MDADDITSGLEDLAMLGQLAILSSRIMPEEKEKTLAEKMGFKEKEECSPVP